MLILPTCPHYSRLKKKAAQMEGFSEFFAHHKELFVTQFIKEVRKYGKLSGMKIRVVLPLVIQVYRHLADFSGPASETVISSLEKLRALDAEPDRILQKLFIMLMLRYLDDYQDDPELMRRVSLLSNYFDGVLRCLLHAKNRSENAAPGARPLRKREVDALFKDGKRCHLFSLYKGIPIRYDGLVRRRPDGGVQLVVPTEKGVVAEAEGRMLLYGDEKDRYGVLMEVRKVGYLEGRAYIDVDRFQRVENYVSRRKSVRVVVSETIKATIRAFSKQFELEVIDISSHGICLEGTTASALPMKELVEVTLPIPDEKGLVRRLVMRGALRYVSHKDPLHRRYHIVLHHDEKKEQIIASFVAREEMRIMQEIKRLAEEKF